MDRILKRLVYDLTKPWPKHSLTHPARPERAKLVRGRCPISAGRGRVMGKLVASELQAARDDKHLYRAVLRAVQKPLSVLLSNLSALLLPLLSSPAFLQPPVPTVQMPNPNATQLHALGIADFAGELLSTFDDTALGIETDSRGDGLQPIRAGLVSLIGRVVTPLITGIKEALIPLLDALEIPDNKLLTKQRDLFTLLSLHSSLPFLSTAEHLHVMRPPTTRIHCLPRS
ncbi:hypothetical protein EV363DRAFT_899878 [Boletus edulis]|nr:hypothetical protein EV363DRAFT_899878 [Boletus edulis]